MNKEVLTELFSDYLRSLRMTRVSASVSTCSASAQSGGRVE